MEACQGHAPWPPGGLWDSPCVGWGLVHPHAVASLLVPLSGQQLPSQASRTLWGGAATCQRNSSAGKTKGLSSPSSSSAGAGMAWQALRRCLAWCSWSLVPLPPPSCAAWCWPSSGKQHASFSATLGKLRLIHRGLVQETCSLPWLALPACQHQWALHCPICWD